MSEHTINIELTDYEVEVLTLAAKQCAEKMEAHRDHTTTPSLKEALGGDAKILREIMRDLTAQREILNIQER